MRSHWCCRHCVEALEGVAAERVIRLLGRVARRSGMCAVECGVVLHCVSRQIDEAFGGPLQRRAKTATATLTQPSRLQTIDPIQCRDEWYAMSTRVLLQSMFAHRLSPSHKERSACSFDSEAMLAPLCYRRLAPSPQNSSQHTAALTSRSLQNIHYHYHRLISYPPPAPDAAPHTVSCLRGVSSAAS